jgi:hypothetical protein
MTAVLPQAGCAEISRAVGEPMVGTAPSARRWLCLEHPDAWPGDINKDPDPAVRALLGRSVAAGFRPLLIRGTVSAPQQRRRVFLIDTVPGAVVATMLAVGRPEELNDLQLPDLDSSLPGEPVPEPLLLICTHDQRDPCCGLAGKVLAATLAGPSVFECSHLGGHRFAPTALVLPTGYLYGRLDPESATAVHRGAAAGEVVTDSCRGRCTWSPGGQVAELAVRTATGHRSPDAVVVLDETGDTVHLRTASGDRWDVELERVEVDTTRPASCGARPTLMAPLRASAVRLVNGPDTMPGIRG